MKGFPHPRTPTGRASVTAGPPWHYAGDLITIEYRTDPGKVAALLPEPPAADDPGAVALIWADWRACSDGGKALLDPVRSQHKECFVVVRCQFAGRTYSRCVRVHLGGQGLFPAAST